MSGGVDMADATAVAEGPVAETPPPRDEGTARGRARRRRRPSGIVVGVALIAALVLVRVFVAEPFRIPSESMAPTIAPGDQALVQKIGGTQAPHRGDVVAFHAPRTGEILLKRVVAVAGDTVGLEDGVLVVNRRKADEPYVDLDTVDSVYFGPVKVPAGTVFVMGDNRANSDDSRDFGAVPTERVIGRAVARVWPPGRIGAIH